MAYPNQVYSDAYKRLTDWLVESNTGGAVTNLARDLLNRAQEELRMYRPWEELSKHEPLTVNSDKSAYLPADCGEIIGIYHDSDNDGRPDWWYWNRSKRVDDGYYFTNDFSRLNGYQRAFHFYAAPSYTPIVWYVRTLEAFTGTGLDTDDVEYSFFPLDLLLVTAQIIHRSEEDLMDGSYAQLVIRKEKLLADYEEAHQFINVDMRMNVTDYDGELVGMDEYSMIGGQTTDISPYDNDVDLRGAGW